MSTFQIPTGPPIGSREFSRFLAAGVGDRRTFLRRAAGIGVALPALGLLADVQAQETPKAGDGHDMTEDGYVGSDPESPSTGDGEPGAGGRAAVHALRSVPALGRGRAEGDHDHRQGCNALCC